MNNDQKRVCPVERAGHLDNKIRRWVQNPRKILGPYVKEGMTVLDQGCGPGFFTIDLAQMVGPSGQVIASDLQAGMLDKLRVKIQGTDLASRIRLHQGAETQIGLTVTIDFVLCFYMVHEVPDQAAFFHELWSFLKPNGSVFIAEPPIHVSKAAFERMVAKACSAGFKTVGKPKVFFSKAVLLKKE